MSKKLLFAAIASILATGAYATSATVTSKDYVDNTFQTKIPAKATASEYSSASLVEATGTPGTVGERKIWDALVDWDNDEEGEESFVNAVDRNGSEEGGYIPTVGAVIDAIDATTYWMQNTISRSGYTDYHGTSLGDFDANFRNSWLNDLVKGTGLVTKTSNDGEVGERKIFEASDVSGYHATGLTQIQKDIQDISIPTVGAMMTAISNNQVTLPTGTPGNVVTYNAQGNIGGSVATYDGSGTYNAGTDAGKIATAAAVNTRQAKKTCAGWPDGTTVPDSTHTDANCWLWNLPD